jgi:hypothetical protein
MGDPSAVLLPDLLLAEIFVRLPSKDFHRCHCLTSAWAAAPRIELWINIKRRDK